ncbi:MAG: hypothetical protein WBZ20_04250 [Nitrososphaeraceae archaeon]
MTSSRKQDGEDKNLEEKLESYPTTNLNSVYARLTHVICKQQPQPLHDTLRDFRRDEVTKEGLF